MFIILINPDDHQMPLRDSYFTVGWLMANVISVHLLECMCDALVCCGCLYLCVF